MKKYGLSLLLKTSLFLVLFSSMFSSCQTGPYLSVFIENNTSDNFRIGGPLGAHIYPGEIKFLTTLTDKESNFDVELWRANTCQVVLYLASVVILNEATMAIDSTVTIHDSTSPIFRCTVNNHFLVAHIGPCDE
jgi:hypothetical protein